MDLKTRKYINNKHPKFFSGFEGLINMSGGDIGGATPSSFGSPTSGPNSASLGRQGAENAIMGGPIYDEKNPLGSPPQIKGGGGLQGGGIAKLSVDTLINGINFVSSLSNTHKYDKSSDQILSEGTQTQGSIGGYGYTNYDVDELKEIREVNAQNEQDALQNMGAGLAFGSSLGGSGIGAAGGGIAGLAIGAGYSAIAGHKAKKKALKRIALAKLSGISKGFLSKSIAQTDAYRDEYTEDVGKRLGEQTKISAYDGLDRVNTSHGVVNGKQNAWVSKGEWIYDGNNLSKVNRGPNDTAPAYLTGKDVVFTHNPKIPAPRGFRTIADAVPYAAATGQLEGLARWQRDMHNAGYYNGKDSYPKYENGLSWVPNALTSGLGILAGWNLYANARRLSIKNPNIYAQNPYEQAGLELLRGLHIDDRPVLRNILDTERRSINDIMSMGGTTGAERMRRALAASYGSKKAYADLIPKIQAQNNAYKSAYGNALISTGAQTAQRLQNANQYNEEYLAKAHAARQQGMEQGIYNVLDNLNQFAANEFKRNTFNKMYSLYAQDVENDRPKIKSNRKANNKATGNGTVSTTPLWTPDPNLKNQMKWVAPNVPAPQLQIGLKKKKGRVTPESVYPTYGAFGMFASPSALWANSVMNKYGIQ